MMAETKSSCCTVAREPDAGAQASTKAEADFACLPDEKEDDCKTDGLEQTDQAQDNRVLIPGGRSYVGTDAPFLPVDEEGPLRTGKIASFWMDSTTVTVKRFARFVRQTG